MVFKVLARNVDAHSKNFTFRMNRKGVRRLSPAYYLTFSVYIAAPAYMNRHSLTINGKNEGIDRKDLEEIGAANDIDDYKGLIYRVAEAVELFEGLCIELGIDRDLIKR